MSKEHLISLGSRPEGERKDIASKGGKKSGEVRRQKRDLREILQTLLQCETNSPVARNNLVRRGVLPTMGAAFIYEALETAGKNPAMAKVILELGGYTLGAQAGEKNNMDDTKIHVYLPENNRVEQ